MKKIFVVALGVVLSFALVGSAYAIDGASLESQTTEGLYDRNDAFDITLRPGLLYQVDRWRLYTNLSAYEEGADAYLIGTSGRLGPGSMAFFYEHHDVESDGRYRESGYSEQEYTTGDFPNYDGRWDYRSSYADSTHDKWEEDDDNFYASYSMDFDGFSLGLSFAPEFGSTTQSFYIYESAPEYYNVTNPTGWFSSSWPCSMWFPSGGDNFSWSSQWTSYAGDGDEYDQFDDGTASSSWSGKQDRDTDYYPIYLESQIHTADNWHMLVGVGYANINVDTDFKGTLTDSWQDRYNVGSATPYVETWDRTISVSGVQGNFGIYDADMDGDLWWFYLEPVYELNDIVSLRMDLSYATEDGDLDTMDGVSGTLDARYVQTYDGDSNTWTIHEDFNASSTGDYERDAWGIEPRVYFNYDPVRFSLGVGYHYDKLEWDGLTNCSKTMDWRFDRDDDVDDDTDDWVFNGSWSEREDFDGEEKTTTWRFPVAAEFDITEKFMARAGACYYHERVEFEEKGTEVGRNDEQWTWVDGAGNTVAGPGPEQYVEASGSLPVPYDADKTGGSWKEEYDDTYDWVTYQIGIGYAFTENLQLDLMWERTNGDHVDFDNLFTSITLAF